MSYAPISGVSTAQLRSPAKSDQIRRWDSGSYDQLRLAAEILEDRPHNLAFAKGHFFARLRFRRVCESSLLVFSQTPAEGRGQRLYADIEILASEQRAKDKNPSKIPYGS